MEKGEDKDEEGEMDVDAMRDHGDVGNPCNVLMEEGGPA